MLTDADMKQIEERGIPVREVNRQLALFKNGVTVPELIAPCTIGSGVTRPDPADMKQAISSFEKAVQQGRITKFVPASGAATRMFKELAAALYQETDSSADRDAVMHRLRDHLDQFAFYEDLVRMLRRRGDNIEDLSSGERRRELLELLLTSKGLDYAQLPKGLIPFHRCKAGSLTAFEEHLAEALELFGTTGTPCRIHFTVAPDHETAIVDHIHTARDAGRFAECRTQLEVTFSIQEPTTDTIAATADNAPFRDKNNRLVFRPGGHGALLGNLNRLDGDLVFIKNIDNIAVAPIRQAVDDDLKALCGLLVERQDRIFSFLRNLSDPSAVEAGALRNMLDFVEQVLLVPPPAAVKNGAADLQADFLRNLFNRPLRVCGVVRHEGEPGGGPFLIRVKQGDLSPQIIEAAQVDMTAPEQKRIWESSTHFNPVIMACGLRDYQGRPFDLTRFSDPDAGIITEKSLDGLTLKALEHPGLWNGAMAFWNTIFVELPSIAFNPVKTVFDLLREAHQPKDS